MSKRTLTKNKVSKAWLYRLVFETRYMKGVMAFLFVFFVLNPAVPIFAADDEVAATESLESPAEAEPKAEKEVVKTEAEPAEVKTGVVTNESDLPTKVVEEREVEVDESVSSSEETFSSDAAVPPKKSVNKASSTESAHTDNVHTGSVATSTDSSKASTTPISTGSATSTKSASSTATSTVSTGSSTPDHVSASSTDPAQATSTSTSTPETEEPALTPAEPMAEEVVDPVGELSDPLDAESVDEASTTQPHIVYVTEESTNDSNRLRFGINDCVSVGDGSYYCTNASTTTARGEEDGVFAAADEGGDKEVYWRKNGQVTQLSHNDLEDASPFYDAFSETVVWHRLIEGRYQIIQYDLNNESETQLTSDHTNHMEPSSAEGVIVWQQWEGDDWEIAALIDDEVSILSSNAYQDIAPVVKDGYVVWQSVGVSGEKLLSVYEIATGITSTVEDPDGGQVANPRFVLVYDTVSDNGDVITKTYDPETGTINPVGSHPAPLPELPDPGPTGEASALINVKTNNRGEGSEELDGLLTTNDGNSDPNTGTSTNLYGTSTTQTASSTVSLEDQATSTIDMSPAVEAEVIELTEFDLIVEPATTSSTSTGTSTVKVTS